MAGNTLSIKVASLATATNLILTYQVKVSEAADPGDAINQVQANSDNASSEVVTATVRVRTPSIINFLKFDDNGVVSVVQPTSYNTNQNGGKNFEEINKITLPDGSIVTLPSPQPILKANEYTEAEPVIIEVIDLDQNLDSEKLETIIVTVEIPGTNDKEILLLTETTPDSGIFRGVILTTSNSTDIQNGVLTIADGVKITVTYRDDEDSTDTSATAALVVPDTSLEISKSVDKSIASIGELVRYTLEFRNTTGFNLPKLKVQDQLPLGFRYVANTALLNGNRLNNGSRNKRTFFVIRFNQYAKWSSMVN